MTNSATEVALEYHEATKHSPISVRMSLHRLDWPNKPLPFKVYTDLPRVPLPRGFAKPTSDTLETISASGGAGGALELDTLARVLYFSAGITKKAVLPDGEEFYFRAAACAGALYPIEIYVVCGDLPGLPAGVYHFSPRDFLLTRLRTGDFRPHLLAASGEDGAVAASATLVLSAIFWRSSWKYQARSYRYCFWDSGTILANMLATAASSNLRSKVVAGFVDDLVNRLIGIDGEREASLCLVPLGSGSEQQGGVADLLPLQAEALPLSREEVNYPEIRRMHVASRLMKGEVRPWKGALRREPPRPRGRTFPLEDHLPEGKPLSDVILRRGSTRRFRQVPISLQDLAAVLRSATGGFQADFLDGPGSSLLDIYLIANSVDGLPSGAYYFSPVQGTLELLKEGTFRSTAGFLCLEQPLAAQASTVIFFLADLRRVLHRYGNRGYRIAQLEAGIVGGRMYLAAYSLGMGATGLTFYDDEVTTFFEPHSRGQDAIFVVALGKAARVRSSVVPVGIGGPSS
jgi:SagB-type dehydrogenase family enzyme